jgi:arginyl-tRNA--protein-N-Asp/Glu arginylyltransferase
MTGYVQRDADREAMTMYDDLCCNEFSVLASRVEHLFIDINIGCPYGLPYVATFHQANFAPLQERAMELFLANGYRRNGNSLYCMRCAECSACLPIRLHIDEFCANRNQKRAVKKNRDVETKLLPLRVSQENIDLCENFLEARYPHENNTARGYYRDFFFNTIVDSCQMQFRLDGKLIGTSIIDFGNNWMNGVYFYFDPREINRSIGTYNIMCLVDLCRKWNIQYLYLGYLIRSVSSMSYKSNFRPHYLFTKEKWRTEK